MAAAAVDCGCRFFSGYPMLPFTGLLDAFARELPAHRRRAHPGRHRDRGRQHGARAPPPPAPRAATGSTGQGISLMQETIAEAALNELPMVFFNVARGQQDYFQAHSRRRVGRLPHDRARPAERGRSRRAHHARVRARRPVDDAGALLRRPHDRLHPDDRRAGRPPDAMKPPPEKPWALDGSSGGTGRSKVVWTWRQGKHNTPGPGPNRHWQSVAEKYDAGRRGRGAPRRTRHTDDAEVVVVSFGTTGAVRRLRGRRAARRRPPHRHVPAGHALAVPSDALAAVAGGDACRLVLVHELERGSDDRRRALGDRRSTSGARHRRREPGRVGHASRRPPPGRRDPGAHPRAKRCETGATR